MTACDGTHPWRLTTGLPVVSSACAAIALFFTTLLAEAPALPAAKELWCPSSVIWEGLCSPGLPPARIPAEPYWVLGPDGPAAAKLNKAVN